MFLGDELSDILSALETGKDYHNKEKQQMEIGVTVLPHFPKDSTDRNRTSPFAFTGNKFEFRMLGSAISIADPNIVLNTAVAEVLRQFADQLEKSQNFKADLAALIKKVFHEHKRIVFNGNNYSEEWVAEAKRLGLSNLKTTVDALPEFISEKSVDLFGKHHVFTKSELHSRYEILIDTYCKTVNIEALTMIDMVKSEVIPASISYQNELAKLLLQKKTLGGYEFSLEAHLLEKIAKLSSSMLEKLGILEKTVAESKEDRELLARAAFYHDKILASMLELRHVVDELETLVARKHWHLPTYAHLLYSVV
jgi:glutamine synthetase